MAEKFNEAAVKKIERFQFWTLNGKGKVIGWFPIAKGMTYDNFIELHYDAKGVVIRIIETVEGYKNKVIRRPRFDAKGRIKYSERQGPDAGVNYRNNYEYDSNGLMVSRHEIDLDTDAMRWKINVKCDAKGNFLDQKYYGPEGDLKTHSVYEYNKNGRKTKQTKFLDGKEIGYFKFVLDEKDREVRRAWYSPDGDEKTSMLSTYNDLDLPIKTVFQDSNGVGKIAEISFTPQGKRIATQLKEKDGTLLKEMRILPDGTPWHKSYRSLPDKMPDGTGIFGPRMKPTDDEAKAMVAAAWGYYEKKDYINALPYFEMSARNIPDDPYFITAAADCCLKMHRFETAYRYYKDALEIDANYEAALEGLDMAKRGMPYLKLN